MPTYILKKGDILIQQTSSISSTTVSVSNLIFGEVALVSDLCDAFEVGDVVLYNSANQLNIVQNNIPYYLIKESDILFIDDNGT